MNKVEKKEYDKKYRLDNIEHDKLRHKEYRLKNLKEIKIKEKLRKHKSYIENPEKFKIKNNTWAKANPEKTLSRRLKRRYGINAEDYERMLKNQNWVCAICLKPETSKHQNGEVKRLAVDHNHITGEVRELLCNNCNVSIGLLGDNILLVKKVLDYLIKWNN